jgi:hypothetical protein
MLEYARAERPEIVGLSHYFWNTALNEQVSKKLRAELGEHVKIVWGGPSIDSDPDVLLSLSQRYPYIDAFIPNEGEPGFANIVEAMLSGSVFTGSLDGVAFNLDGSLVAGAEIGLLTDLLL